MDNKESFELDFLEEILRDGCDTYARRLKIYQPIVDSILSRVTDEMFAEDPYQSNRTRNWFQIDWFLYNLKFNHSFKNDSTVYL